MSTKYIFITGGVVSSLGKGITAASLGQLLKSRGLKVTLQKLDPYLNIDPGTMSPYQHGEVFVTEDGAETDLDLGHYERFVDVNLTKFSSVTSGKVYSTVINKERKGDYDGRTVQVIPHITNEIKERIYQVGKEGNFDIVITEVGGTVGDIESLPFLEAIRQVKHEVGIENVMYIHVTLVPYLGKAGELKTKPTQHSVKEIRSIGIQPDVVVCRTEKHLSQDMRDKIGLFCNLEPSNVVENMDAQSLYEVPLLLREEKLDEITIKRLNLQAGDLDLKHWQEVVARDKNPKGRVKIALIGKYIELRDAYISVSEALTHAGIYNDVKAEIDWIQSENLNDENIGDALKTVDGILIPSGFGERGVEGKISAIKYARENKIPLLGICLGMQLILVEFARNVLGLTDANSTEINPDTDHPVVHLMPNQKDIDSMGGSMRLGLFPCKVNAGTKARQAYGEDLIYERHRHRYEVNNEYREKLTEAGLIISGISPDERLVEMIELKDHPWFVGVQFHPEFKSRPTRPHPLFRDFVKVSVNKKEK